MDCISGNVCVYICVCFVVLTASIDYYVLSIDWFFTLVVGTDCYLLCLTELHP